MIIILYFAFKTGDTNKEMQNNNNDNDDLVKI